MPCMTGSCASYHNSRLWLIGLVVLLLVYLAMLLYRIAYSMRKIQAANIELSDMHAQLQRDLKARTEAERRFRQLFEIIPDGVGMHRNGRWLYVNPAAVVMFGAATDAALIGSEVLDRVHPDDRDAVMLRMQQSQPAPLMIQLSLRMDGSLFTGEVQSVPCVEDGAPATLVVIRDISDRVAAERRYRTLVEQSPLGIQILSPDGFTLRVNRVWEQLWGVRLADVEGYCILEDQQLETRGVMPCIRDGFAGQASELPAINYNPAENSMFSGPASDRWVKAWIYPVKDRSGRIMEVVLMHEDVTDKIQTVNRLQQMAVAVENTAEMIMISDHESRIQYVNPAFERLTGYTLHALVGQFELMLHSDQADAALCCDICAAVNGGDIWKGELVIRNSRGELLTTERSVSPVIDDEGRVTHHITVMHEITEERRRNRKMEHVQRLESLGILAGGIAHDFNNILTAIMGNAAMAERGLSDASPARVQLSRITESSRRASELCRQMLAYSGKGRFVVKPLNLSLLVAEMTRLMEVSIGKNVQLTYQLDESLPMVEADAAQIQQVVLNLITNANEVIGEQSGVISFSTGVMQADADYLSSSVTRKALPEGRYVWLEVSDTGCGMDAATAEKIFDPFFTTKFTGRGLGMSAVLGIVRGHHGALRVFSEPGQGATFRMLLPIAQDSSASASLSVDAIAVEHGPFGEGVVLVVDDEETIREVAVLMLEEIGFATLTAVNGQDAVDIYRQHAGEIVAVLLDMTMPKMDGSECFYALRRINPDVKVVLSSGYSEEEATTRFIGQGLGGFLHKPYTPEDLRATMTSILQ